MKFILLVFILTGEHHGIQTQEFGSRSSCESAAQVINERSKQTWRKEWRPFAWCEPRS